MVNKKAQMKIQQMAFMLMAITLFFVMVGLFLLTTTFSGLKDKAESLDEKNALLMVSKLSSSPEFSCGESFGSQRVNCVDADKLMGLLTKKEQYQSFWGMDLIQVRKIVPVGEEIECNLSTYPNCNLFNIHSTANIAGDKSIFVSLCRKDLDNGRTYNKCELGKLYAGF